MATTQPPRSGINRPTQVTHFEPIPRQPEQAVALKEWAVVCMALRTGKQVLMMRKGGIREETKHFALRDQSFYLYPTYEHQKSHLLKPEFQEGLKDTLSSWNPDAKEVTITAFAQVTEDIEIYDPALLSRLLPYHIWTAGFAEERLRWKPYHPLHLLLVRVFQLSQPVHVPILEAYLGCKSWIQLQTDVSRQDVQPALDDGSFQEKRAQILKLL